MMQSRIDPLNQLPTWRLLTLLPCSICFVVAALYLAIAILLHGSINPWGIRIYVAGVVVYAATEFWCWEQRQ